MRPTIFTEQLADAICERIANGESVRSISRDEAMPAMSTIFRWLVQDEKFSEQYARAKEEQAEAFADEIVSIADEENIAVKSFDGGLTAVVFDSTAVARNRLRIDARKWVASKLKPKKYGDRIETSHTGPDGGPVKVEANLTISAEEAYKRMLNG